jgi:ceramide glucosyltransferase
MVCGVAIAARQRYSQAAMSLTLFAGLLCAVTSGAHFATALAAARRLRRAKGSVAVADTPPVSILRPVCGLENHIEETLATSFSLDYPRYEVIFCVACDSDPVIPLVRRLMAAHPRVPSRLLVGDDRLSINPKLNNLVKGWAAARHDWIVIADSNVLLPPDYVQQLLSRWTAGTGVVSAPGAGAAPDGVWAELECAFLNTYQARWLLAADSVGLGYVHGKTMLLRRSDLEEAGGIAALTEEVAEDLAATKILRRKGLKVRLTLAPFLQPLGCRSFAAVWRRQVRWARLRRAGFPVLYAHEIAAGGLLPIALLALVAAGQGLHPGWLGAFVLAWYGAEALVAVAAGWHLSAKSVLCWVLRDLLQPILWAAGWLGNRFEWRGNGMEVSDEVRLAWPRLMALVRRLRGSRPQPASPDA